MKNRIRELRKTRGMTMKQLGEVVGLAESTISQYETGKRQPDNETLLKLGELFEVTVDYLLGAAQKETAPTPKSERSIEKDDLKFALWGTSDIDDDLLDEVKRFADFAKERRHGKSD